MYGKKFKQEVFNDKLSLDYDNLLINDFKPRILFH